MLRSEIARLTAELQSERSQRERVEQELEQIQIDLESAKIDLEQLTLENEDLQEELEVAKAEANQANQNVEAHVAKVLELKSRLGQGEMEDSFEVDGYVTKLQDDVVRYRTALTLLLAEYRQLKSQRVELVTQNIERALPRAPKWSRGKIGA